VHLVGRTGADRFAEIPLAALREEGVDLTFVEALPDSHTGTATIVIDAATRENAIAVAGGANRALEPEHVREALSAFRASAVLLVQLEAPIETVDEALDLLRKVDVLTPNESEAALLSGLEVHDIESAAAAGTRLRERTQGDVIVTLGALGCVWVSSTGFEHVSAPQVDPVDTTGAGDAFNGALAVALARGEPLPKALRAAVEAGTASTLTRGAAPSMPGRVSAG
jgi:ribokinase